MDHTNLEYRMGGRSCLIDINVSPKNMQHFAQQDCLQAGSFTLTEDVVVSLLTGASTTFISISFLFDVQAFIGLFLLCQHISIKHLMNQ